MAAVSAKVMMVALLPCLVLRALPRHVVVRLLAEVLAEAFTVPLLVLL